MVQLASLNISEPRDEVEARMAMRMLSAEIAHMERWLSVCEATGERREVAIVWYQVEEEAASGVDRVAKRPKECYR